MQMAARITAGRGAWWPVIVALAMVALASAPRSARGQTSGMLRLRLGQGLVEGQALHWSERQVALLSRDGRLIFFRPDEARDYSQSASRFYSYSASEMRSALLAEFGRAVEVTGTQHYLVVHPKGERTKWAKRFEDLYRAFYHYFSVRGQKLHQPKYPLVAVVFASQQEFLSHAAANGSKLGKRTLGYYSPTTNRIYLYDATAGGAHQNWASTASTIIHEATHQAAFNTGVHHRFAEVPLWVVEGLATMFEAPGVRNSKSYHSASDRINRSRMIGYRQFEKRRQKDSFEKMITSDRLFASDPAGAYGQAWAVSHFLCETRPRQYTRYLALTAGRPDFSKYSAEEREADFKQIFGSNLKVLDAELTRFIAKIR